MRRPRPMISVLQLALLTSVHCERIDDEADLRKSSGRLGRKSLLSLNEKLTRTDGDEQVDAKLTHETIGNSSEQLERARRAKLWTSLWEAPEWQDVKTIRSCPQCGRHVVYLTFDDGPADTFPEFANKLHEVGAKATFFWCARSAKYKLAEFKDLPDYKKQEFKERKFRHFDLAEFKGAMQNHLLGSHTWSHPHLTSLAHEKLDREIGEAHEELASLDLNQGKKITLFRPPYGEYNQEVIDYMKEHKIPYTVVLWDIDTSDWDTHAIQTTEDINQQIDAQWGGADGGDAGHIILMHEGKNKADNVDSIEKVVKHIRDLCPDCEFQSLDQCPLFINKGASEGSCDRKNS